MKHKKIYILSILLSFAFINIVSQNKKLSYFGSYNYGLGNRIAKVSSALAYPSNEEVSKLKSGTINQFELGVYYQSFGLGFIHNTYATKVSTSYENADIDMDGFYENGILRDNLNLNFNGLELLYKIPVLNKNFNVVWKIGLGFQTYSINKDINTEGAYSAHYNYTLTGNKLTTMAGIELNYQLWKNIGIGLETSIIPGNYTELKNAASPSYVYKDNVTRLSTGLKIKVTI